MTDTKEEAGTPDFLSNEEIKQLYAELTSAFAGRNSEYATAREFYAGEHWGQDGLPKPPPTSSRHTITMNYIRPTVRKTVQLLIGQMPAIQVLPPGTDEAARRLAEGMEAVIYNTWDVNEAAKVFRRVAHNMTLLRRGIISYWWDAKDKKVRFRSIAPDNFYPLYDGEEVIEAVVVSVRATRALRRQYPHLASKIVPDQDGDDVFDESQWSRMYMGTNNGPLDESSTSASQTNSQLMLSGRTTVYDWYDNQGNWVRLMGDARHEQKLGYNLGVPFIEFPHDLSRDEGEPDSEIDDIRGLNLYMDKLVSESADIIEKYADPTIIAKHAGVAPTVIRSTVREKGGVLPINREGEVSFLTWDGAPPDLDNQFARVQQGIYDLSGKPPAAYGQMETNQSGVATNMALSPTTSSTEELLSIFGTGLQKLNAAILCLNEKFMKGEEIDVRGMRPSAKNQRRMVTYQATIRGADIGGWYQNRIKWPSVMRTDDPVYVQNELAKMQSDPPAQSVYTTLENLGIEDVEMELDRIKEQLADPRFHPDVMTAAMGAVGQMQESPLEEEMAAVAPGTTPGPEPESGPTRESVNRNAVAAGSPYRDAMVDGGY